MLQDFKVAIGKLRPIEAEVILKTTGIFGNGTSETNPLRPKGVPSLRSVARLGRNNEKRGHDFRRDPLDTAWKYPHGDSNPGP